MAGKARSRDYLVSDWMNSMEIENDWLKSDIVMQREILLDARFRNISP